MAKRSGEKLRDNNRKSWIVWLLTSMILLLSLAAFAEPQEEGTVRGTIKDETDSSIADTRILFRLDTTLTAHSKVAGANQDREITVDKNGVFEINLPKGIYDVFISAPAFSPHCQKIRVKHKVELHIKLPLDQKTVEEMD